MPGVCPAPTTSLRHPNPPSLTDSSYIRGQWLEFSCSPPSVVSARGRPPRREDGTSCEVVASSGNARSLLDRPGFTSRHQTPAASRLGSPSSPAGPLWLSHAHLSLSSRRPGSSTPHPQPRSILGQHTDQGLAGHAGPRRQRAGLAPQARVPRVPGVPRMPGVPRVPRAACRAQAEGAVGGPGLELAASSSERAALVAEGQEAHEEEQEEGYHEHGSGADLERDGQFRVTLRLVETSMLAATAGVAYFIANNLRIEGYFTFFFPLPAVISAVRWGPTFGLRCMTSTALLLFVLSGPLKATTFVLMHGLFGAVLGLLWSLRVPWPVSIALTALVRTAGLTGFVLLSSWLIRENILKLILMNLQAGLTLGLSTLGFDLVPSMGLIYGIFYTLLIFNSCMFSLIIHFIFTLFLRRLGMDSAFKVPAWLDRNLGQG